MGAHLSPQVLGRLKQSVIVTSTGASTRIEGAILSNAQVAKILQGIKIQKLITRDQQAVAGYAELLANVFASYVKIKFSENIITHFHSELLKYSAKDQRHRSHYKFTSNRVAAHDQRGHLVGILFDPTPPHLVSKAMLELVEWTAAAQQEKTIHPLLVIANFVLEFLAIHPFQDGHGRTSRVLTNLLLLKSDYSYMPYVSHEKLIEDNKTAYYLALNQSQKTFTTPKVDISPWLLFFLQVVHEQSKRAITLIKQPNIEALLSERQLLVWNYMQEHAAVTRQELNLTLKIPIPTLVQTLNKLLALHQIERLGSGRGTRYRLNIPS